MAATPQRRPHARRRHAARLVVGAVVSLLALAPTAAVATPAPAAAEQGPWKATTADVDGSHPDADKAASKAARDDDKAVSKAARDDDKAVSKAARDDDKAARKVEKQGDTPPSGTDRPVPERPDGDGDGAGPPAAEPAPTAPGPPPPSAEDRGPSTPAPTDTAEAPATTRPVRATGSPFPPSERAAAAPERSTSETLRDVIDVAAGTTGDVGGAVAASLGAAATAAGERLASGLTAAARTAPEVPVPARDLGVPIGVLALIGAYLATSRWLDRGGLPMTVTEGGEDDVQLVL